MGHFLKFFVDDVIPCPAGGANAAGFPKEKLGKIQQDLHDVPVVVEDHQGAATSYILGGHQVPHRNLPVFLVHADTFP